MGRGGFYGLLASLPGQLFRGTDFAEQYCARTKATDHPLRYVNVQY